MNYEIKRELQNIISRNEQKGERNIIQSATNYLRRSKAASKNAKEGKFAKQEETEYLIDYISANSLWIKSFQRYSYLSEGAEQKVFLSEDTNHVLKLNTSFYRYRFLYYFIFLL